MCDLIITSIQKPNQAGFRHIGPWNSLPGLLTYITTCANLGQPLYTACMAVSIKSTRRKYEKV